MDWQYFGLKSPIFELISQCPINSQNLPEWLYLAMERSYSKSLYISFVAVFLYHPIGMSWNSDQDLTANCRFVQQCIPLNLELRRDNRTSSSYRKYGTSVQRKCSLWFNWIRLNSCYSKSLKIVNKSSQVQRLMAGPTFCIILFS